MENYNFTLWEFLIIKIPIYIFHIWLSKAHVEAPMYGSIISAGVLLKIGRYGLIRLIEIWLFNENELGYVISLKRTPKRAETFKNKEDFA